MHHLAKLPLTSSVRGKELSVLPVGCSRSVIDEHRYSSFPKIFSFSGQIPDTLNPDKIFFEVNASGYAFPANSATLYTYSDWLSWVV